MRIAREEIFGPVVSVMPCRSLDEAIAIGNGVEYGLSASIYTQDINRAFTAMRDLYTGIFYVNAPTIGAEVHLPFGGTKNTGNGHREAGVAALDVFSEWKSIYIDFSGKLQRAQIDRRGDLRSNWVLRALWLRPIRSGASVPLDGARLRIVCRPGRSARASARPSVLVGNVVLSPSSAGWRCVTILLRRRSWAAASACSGTPTRSAMASGSSGTSAGPSTSFLRRSASWLQWHTVFSLCGGIGP